MLQTQFQPQEIVSLEGTFTMWSSGTEPPHRDFAIIQMPLLSWSDTQLDAADENPGKYGEAQEHWATQETQVTGS